jgi:cytochrome o ubiquinol oxidase operon protein cyoD
MSAPQHDNPVSATSYLVGLALALTLTAIPFGFVAAPLLSPSTTLAIIAVSAIAQIVVHLRFFLHLGLKRSPPEMLVTLCFAAVLIVIMAGGSLWILSDLHYRMMGG